MSEINYGYIKLEGIDGESGDDKHKNWTGFGNIGIQTANPASIDGVSGLTAGTPVIDLIFIAFELEKAHIAMRKYLLQGKHIKTVTIEVMKRGEAIDIVWQKILLSQSLIVHSTVSLSRNSGYCQIGIDYQQYEETYTGQKPDGTADAATHHGYDRYANKVI